MQPRQRFEAKHTPTRNIVQNRLVFRLVAVLQTRAISRSRFDVRSRPNNGQYVKQRAAWFLLNTVGSWTVRA